MALPRPVNSVLRIGGVLAVLYAALVVLVFVCQRSLIYFPSHANRPSALAPWSNGEQTIGYCREVQNPRTIWLMMHGNGGQAADRSYVLGRLSLQDSLYVLEYPGYGSRKGSPSLESINEASSQAYQLLRSRYPATPVAVLGESLGSGPACALARQKPPPDKIVLAVPYDKLANVAAGQFPFLPVRLLLQDAWDNVRSLKQFAGPIQIFGAIEDSVIPNDHARALAREVGSAQLILIPGGHNDWASREEVRIGL